MLGVILVAVSKGQVYDNQFNERIISRLKDVPVGDLSALENQGREFLAEGEDCVSFAVGTYALARAAVGRGEYDRANVLLDERPECLMGATNLRYLMGQLAFIEERYAAARDHWRFVAAHVKGANLLGATQNIGACHQREGSLDSAQYYYEEALRLQGDDIQPMTLNNIVSILNERHEYAEVGTFFEVGKSLPVTDSTALDMMYWNMISAQVMLNNPQLAREVFDDRLARGFSGVPEYAVQVHWGYLLMLDDYEGFIKHRAGLSQDYLTRSHANAEPYLKDLFDDGEFSEIGRLPLSVKWVIAKRGLEVEQEVAQSGLPNGSVIILQEKLQRMIEERQWLNRFLLGSGSLLLLVLTAYVWKLNRQKRSREMVASRLHFGASDHKSIQLIRDALVTRSNNEEAIAHLAELKDLLEAKQELSMMRLNEQSALTESELKLLELIGKGYAASECAKLMNCTKSHVYNLRSQIRKKLHLDESESLKAWVTREMSQ